MSQPAAIERFHRLEDGANTFGKWTGRIAGTAIQAVAGLELARDTITLASEASHNLSMTALRPSALNMAADIGLVLVGKVLAGPVADYFQDQIGQYRDRQIG